MPALDGTGPAGAGPMTGRGMGPCGRGYGYGKGHGRGFGQGIGFGRRFMGWFGWGNNYPQSSYQIDPKEEKAMLKDEIKAMQERLKELEK